MKTNLFNARHHAPVGPGGWFCSCCGPAPKNRKVTVKQHKRKITRMLDRLERLAHEGQITHGAHELTV